VDAKGRKETDWDSLAALQAGGPRQRAAHRALMELGIFTRLARYDPVLAGTLPLGIDTPSSDLDILCHVVDLDMFAAVVCGFYGGHPDFALRRTQKNELPVVIATFTYSSSGSEFFRIEIFGQPRPSRAQHAYRHMLAEWRLLEIARRLDGGRDRARVALRALKLRGIKTEPAFGRYFHLPGNPYETLLRLAHAEERELVRIARAAFDC
jgi:hypothetical protein